MAVNLDVLEQPSPQTSRVLQSLMTAVAAADQRLVAVGERGTIMLSDDNGVTWRQATVPVSVTLTNVVFASARAGWAIGHGGVVLATTDGGETWTKQLDGRAAADIEAAAAQVASAEAGPDDAIVARRGREAKRMLADGPDKPFLGIHFSDDKRGMIVGAYGIAFATDDGGKTWQSIMGRMEEADGRHLVSILPADSGLYIVGEQGLVLKSVDGGRSFAALETPSEGTFFGAVSAGPDTIIAFGLRGNVVRSSDAGETWTGLTMPPVSVTAGVRLADGSLILADELGNVLRSRDGGQTFQPVPVAQPMSLIGVTQAPDGKLILAGVRGTMRLAIEDASAEIRK